MPNTTRLDPTRTTLLRRQFIADLHRRFAALSRDVRRTVVDDDVFGLSEPADRKPLRRAGLRILQERRAYQFLTNPQKMAAFQKWLQERVGQQLLAVEGVPGKPWTSRYVHSAYRQGVLRAYSETHKVAYAMAAPEWVTASKETFLRVAFGQPEVMSKLELVATRAFEQLKGITAQMSQEISRHLADGLAHGWAPVKIARAMQKTITNIDRVRARRIARTEVINAHAEGQLDAFELLNIEKVGVMAEWKTAGDGLVCEECYALEGHEYTIDEARGMLPLHPNCRCAWVPSEQKEGR